MKSWLRKKTRTSEKMTISQEGGKEGSRERKKR
jgi:hypothetical protein